VSLSSPPLQSSEMDRSRGVLKEISDETLFRDVSSITATHPRSPSSASSDIVFAPNLETKRSNKDSTSDSRASLRYVRTVSVDEVASKPTLDIEGSRRSTEGS
jgi:hypothetical protein